MLGKIQNIWLTWMSLPGRGKFSITPYSFGHEMLTWKSMVDRFCETKPLLRNSFDETWTASELDVVDFDNWSFTFQLECNEENSCEGYVCEDVFDKFKSCMAYKAPRSRSSTDITIGVQDDATINWGELELDCGTLSYSIDNGGAADADKKALEWESEPSCFSSDEFGDHRDIQDTQVRRNSYWPCESAEKSAIKKDDPDTFVFYQRWAGGAPYQYNIWWKDGCELENGETEQWASDPLGDGSSDVCETTLYDAYKDCNNGGAGGSWQAGCLLYEFKAQVSE